MIKISDVFSDNYNNDNNLKIFLKYILFQYVHVIYI